MKKSKKDSIRKIKTALWKTPYWNVKKKKELEDKLLKLQGLIP